MAKIAENLASRLIELAFKPIEEALINAFTGLGGGPGGLAGIGGLLGGRSGGGGLASMLDMDGDGNPLDDILNMAGKRMR